MNSCSPDFLCIAYTLVCESQFVGDFIRMRVTYTANWDSQLTKSLFQTRSNADERSMKKCKIRSNYSAGSNCECTGQLR